MNTTQQHLLASIGKFLERLLLAGAHLLALAAAAWLILRFYPGDQWVPVRMGSYFAPWLFMALAPGLVIVWLKRQRRLAGLIALLIAIYTVYYWPALIPRQTPAYAQLDAKDLRVMTYNVNFNNGNVADMAALIRAESPDLIAFQEMLDELAIPVVKIDHIFASRHFTPIEAHVAPTSAGSDHRPVIATLQFQDFN